MLKQLCSFECRRTFEKNDLKIGNCGHLGCLYCLRAKVECITCQQIMLDQLKQIQIGKTTPSGNPTINRPVGTPGTPVSPVNQRSPVSLTPSPNKSNSPFLSPVTSKAPVIPAIVTENNTIYVGNLPFGIKELTLRFLFSLCGYIEKVTVYNITDSNGIKRAYGFVMFSKAESMAQARKFHGKVFESLVIQVIDASLAEYSLSVKNLPPTLSSQQLRTYFEHFGKIRTAIAHRDTNGSLTFLNDKDRRMVQQSHLTINGFVLRMSFYERTYFISDMSNENGCFAMHIKNIPNGTTKEHLNNMFALCGCIIKDKTYVCPRNSPYVYGFVNFTSAEANDFALTFDNNLVDGWSKPIILNKDDKQRQNNQTPGLSSAKSEPKLSPNHTPHLVNRSASVNSLNDNFTVDSLRNLGVKIFTKDSSYNTIAIGRGHYGTVSKTVFPFIGQVAVKMFIENHRKEKQREIETMITASYHPNIVTFIGVLVDNGQANVIGYVMEYMCNHSLHTALHESSIHIGDRIKYAWIFQAADALAFLHSRQVIHRDVKPANMLLKDNYNHLSICDMGTTRTFELDVTMTMGEIGTLGYAAPEVIYPNKEKRYNCSADVYSLGISIWEIMTRRVPYQHVGQVGGFALVWLIAHSHERPQLDEITDWNMKSFIARCWGANAANRPRMVEIMDYFINRK